jgi:DNA-binding transcriptional LysR family regulator
MNISSVNLNLLVAFEALLEERSVSRAAKRAGLSQPAMSNALSRLRATFGDPLFKRTSRGISPTARALDLAAPIRSGLAQLRTVFEKRPDFDLAASTRVFRLAMTDYAEFLTLPRLMRRIETAAPHVQILTRRVDRIFIAPEPELRAGDFDAAIGFFPEESGLDPGTRSCDLFTEENVCILRRGHPALRKQFTLRQFASAGHVGVFYKPEARGLIDNLLAGHGLRRRLQTTTPHFVVAPFLVARSDLIAVMPAGLAASFRKLLPLEIRPVPLHLPPFRMRLLWHEHLEDDPGHRWLRTELIASFSAAK